MVLPDPRYEHPLQPHCLDNLAAVHPTLAGKGQHRPNSLSQPVATLPHAAGIAFWRRRNFMFDVPLNQRRWRYIGKQYDPF
jgi:hypothetical protein